MKTDKHLVLDSIYLDTNIVVSATLETDPTWQANHPCDAKKVIEISSSKEILEKWDKRNLKVSPYTIGEFISIGKRQFNKTHEEMLAIVSNTIEQRCTILQSIITEKEVPKLSNDPLDNLWQLANINLEGDAIDENGRPVGKGNVRIIVHTSGIVSTAWGGFGSTIGNLKIRKLSKVEYSTPAYEMMLFSKAAEMSLKYGINLRDAIHLVYIRCEEIDVIVSNDKDFQRWNNLPKELKGDIEVMTSEQVLERNRKYLDA